MQPCSKTLPAEFNSYPTLQFFLPTFRLPLASCVSSLSNNLPCSTAVLSLTYLISEHTGKYYLLEFCPCLCFFQGFKPCPKEELANAMDFTLKCSDVTHALWPPSLRLQVTDTDFPTWEIVKCCTQYEVQLVSHSSGAKLIIYHTV